MTAARIPPTSGATMKSQTWLSAVPPTTSAGPRLRAGFTEVPVSGIPMRWTITRAKPMATPAAPWMAALCVANSTTETKIVVSTTSIRNAPPWLTWSSDCLP